MKILFNPFEKIAGVKSLFIGITAVLLAGAIGYFSKTHFDGILNVHTGIQSPWYVHIIEPFFSVATIALWFLLFAKIFGKENIRTIDVIGTQFFAFIPLVPASFMGFFNVTAVINAQLKQLITNPTGTIDIAPEQLFAFAILLIVVMLLMVWSAIWIYKGFKTSANLPNQIHIPVYISGIIVAMIVPKLFTLFIF